MTHNRTLYSSMGWLTCSLFYAYVMMVISAFTIAGPSLQGNLGIGQAGFAFIVSVYLTAYAGMQIPVGILLDHFSIRKMMTSAIGLFTLGCLVLATSDSYQVVLVTRFIMGASGAFSVLGAFKVATEWFSPKQFATLAGSTVSIGMLGSIAGNHYMSIVMSANAWAYQTYFFNAFVIGCILTLSSAVFVSNVKAPVGKITSLAEINTDIKSVLMNKQSMTLIIFAMLMYTPFLILKDTFGGIFLQNHYGISEVFATNLMSSMLFAALIAAPTLGAISDRLGKRIPLMRICAYLLLVLLVLILFKVTPISASIVLFSFFSWGFLISYTIFKETHAEKIVSTGLGVMNSVNMLGGIVLPPVIGGVLDLIPVYITSISPEQAYFYAFLILPAVIMIAIPLINTIPETNCKQVVK